MLDQRKEKEKQKYLLKRRMQITISKKRNKKEDVFHLEDMIQRINESEKNN